MIDMEKVIKGLEKLRNDLGYGLPDRSNVVMEYLNSLTDAMAMLKEKEKENKALHLLVEWAEECDFGYDQFPNEYERYKDEIKDMKYIDGMIHVAKRTLENHGAFEEGW